MTNSNKYLLSTRPIADELLLLAATQGVKISCVPFTRQVYKKDEYTAKSISTYSKHRILAVFTSVTAVRAIMNHCTEPPPWSIACIDGATQRAVVNFWGKDAICCTAEDAASLAIAIVRSKMLRIYVFFCGDRRRGELSQGLHQYGTAISELVVYETIDSPSALTTAYDGILFFSPSAVDSFFSLNRVDDGTAIFAIGATTAASIREHTNNHLIVSPYHSQEAMIHHIIAYYKNEK